MKLALVARFDKKKNHCLFIRIGGLGKFVEVSLNKKSSRWSIRNNTVTGHGAELDELREFIDTAKYDLQRAFRELHLEGKQITAQKVKDRYLGKDQEQAYGLLQMFDYHYTRSADEQWAR